MTEHNNPGPPEQCYDDCPTNRTGDTEDCTCAGTALDSDAALFARQRDDAQAIVLAVSRILGISHLADGLEHGRVTDTVRSWMDTAVRLTRERDEAQAEVDAVTAERDKLANDLGDLNLIHSVVTENEDDLRHAGHRIAGLFNRDPEDHQIAGVLRDVAEELIVWRTDSTQVPDGWRSLVRKGWSVGARPAIPADAEEGTFGQRCEELGRIPAGRYYLTSGVEVGDNREVVSRFDIPGGVRIAGFWPSHKARIEPAPVSGSDTTEDGGDR